MSIVSAGVREAYAIALSDYSVRLREANNRVELYHAAIANARKQGLLVPSVIAAVDEANFPQDQQVWQGETK